MKFYKYLVLLFVFSILYSCSKDLDEFIPTSQNVQKSELTQYSDWNDTEKQFFTFESLKVNARKSERRDEIPFFHKSSIKAYNYLAELNQNSPFIEKIVEKVGYPLWNFSHVYDNENLGIEKVAIPFAFAQEDKVTAIISVTFSEQDQIVSVFKPSEVQYNLDNCKNLHDVSLMMNFNFNIFGDHNQNIHEAYCACLENSVPPSAPTGPIEECDWFPIELCVDFDTQLGFQAGHHIFHQDDDNDGIPNMYDEDWIVFSKLGDHDEDGVANEDDQDWYDFMDRHNTIYPPHLDHDLDGILNDDDQDWYEFLQRINISEEQFYAAIKDGWEYYGLEQEYGDYDEFWSDMDDFYFDWDDQYGDDFFEDLWDDMQDIWDEAWDWWHDDDRDGNGIDDRYDDCDDIWDDSPLTEGIEVSSREIECEWYYVKDCTGAIEGDLSTWWQDTFDDVIPCPACNSDQELQNEDQYQLIFFNEFTTEFELSTEEIQLMSGTISECPGLVGYEAFRECLMEKFVRHIDIECKEMLKGFCDQYEYELSLDEEFYILRYINKNGCSYDFDEIIKLRLVHFNLQSTEAEYWWLLDNSVVLNQLFLLLPSPDYEKSELHYILWAVKNHGNTVAYYTSKKDVYLGEDEEYTASCPEGIEILSSYSPSTPPPPNPAFIQTEWKDGQEYDLGNNVIPPDLQSGTNGDDNLLSPKFPNTKALLNEPEAVLLNNFYNLIHQPQLNRFNKGVATEFYNHWVANSGSDYYSSALSDYVANNEHMKQTVKDFAKNLNERLKFTGGDINTISKHDLEENFLAKFHKGEKSTGLGILVNDTEKLVTYEMGDFEYNIASNKWSGTFYFQIWDNFGLDDDDLLEFQGWYLSGQPYNIGFNFASWWILQHKFENKPFRTEIRHVAKISGDLNL